MTHRKTLRAIPLLTVERKDNAMEYLVDLKTNQPQPLAKVHIAEQLAGIPWTATRVRQHIVNEVAQALYKVFVFTNPSLNPLQRWKHGKWFARWEGDKEGDQTCTLYVCLKVQEQKLKPKKGHNVGWQKLPDDVRDRIQSHIEDTIETFADEDLFWSKPAKKTQHPPSASTQLTTTVHPNRFSILSEADTNTPSSLYEVE